MLKDFVAHSGSSTSAAEIFREEVVSISKKSNLTYIDLFAGIGGFHQAAKPLGWKCVFASEIDKFAALSYSENYGINPAGDITQVEARDIPPHDILFAGFPCQPFSIIGSGKGFEDTRGTLFFEIARILEEKKPPIFVLENVKRLVNHDQGRTFSRILSTLDELGYTTHWKILNALDYGLPQKRERVIIVGFLDPKISFKFPEPTPMKPLSALLFDDAVVDAKHFVSPAIALKRKASHSARHELSIWHENKSGNISSYPYSCALRAGASYNYLLVNGVRRLIPREMLRLQGFPDSFNIVCSDAQTRKQAGNAVPVNMIHEVLKEIKNAIA